MSCLATRFFEITDRTMPKAKGRSAFAAVCCAVLSGSLMTYSNSSAAEAPPQDLVQMRSGFAAAVAAKNIAALEALIRFPLENDVYGEPKSISRAAFAKHAISYWQMADCIKTAPLEHDVHEKPGTKSWLLNCNGNVFYFALDKGRWVHSEYQNINE